MLNLLFNCDNIRNKLACLCMFLCVGFQFRIRYSCQRIIKTVIISSISAKTKLLSI